MPDSQSLCERSWFLGAEGVYNVSTSICACPDGYSGNDDWSAFNSCHVNESIAEKLKLAVFISSSAQVVLTVCCLIWVVNKWEFSGTAFSSPSLRKLSKTSVKNKRSSSKVSTSKISTGLQNTPRADYEGPGDVEELPDLEDLSDDENADRFSKFNFFRKPRNDGDMSAIREITVKREWRRKKGAIFALSFALVYGLVLASYVGLQYFGNNPWRKFTGETYQVIILNALLSLASIILMIAYYSLLVSLYNTLPSVSRYGGLLKMTPFFVRHPYLVFSISNGVIWITIVASLVLLVILPEFVIDNRMITDQLFIGLMTSLFILFVVMMSLIVHNVKLIYRMMITNLESPNPSLSYPSDVKRDELKNCRRSLKVARYFNIVSWTLAIPAIAVFVAMIWMELRYTYILIHAIGILSVMTCALISLLMISTDGGLVAHVA